MTLTQLKYILAVSDHLSFVRAAEECNVAQPSLSMQIKKLEDELELRIFDRSPTGVVVTEMGEAILAQARVVLDEASRIYEIGASKKPDQLKGTLKIGIIPTIGPYLTPYFLDSIGREFPLLQIQFIEDKTESLVRALEFGKIDAAILSTPENASLNLIERTLYYEPFVVFANEKHPLLKNQKVKISDLQTYTPTLLDETHCMRDQVGEVCGNAARLSSQMKLVQGTLPMLLVIVDQGESFTLLPILAVHSLTPHQQKKQIRPILNPAPTRKVSLVFHKSFVKKSLIEILEKNILAHLPHEVEKRLSSKIEVLDPGLDHFQS